MDFAEFLRKHLSFSGTATRSTYWKYQVIDGFVAPMFVVGLFFLDMWINQWDHIHPATMILGIAILCFTAWSTVAISVRRFRDLGMSPWNYLALMVPVWGFYLSILLGFKAGVSSGNLAAEHDYR